MSYILSGSTIRRPGTVDERNSTQMAQHRTLDGTISRDYFGSNKRVWVLGYENVNTTDYTTIRNLYNTYLSNAVALTWEVTETNYTVSQTNVHVDLVDRGFRVKGTDYISDFDLILTEQ